MNIYYEWPIPRFISKGKVKKLTLRNTGVEIAAWGILALIVRKRLFLRNNVHPNNTTIACAATRFQSFPKWAILLMLINGFGKESPGNFCTFFFCLACWLCFWYTVSRRFSLYCREFLRKLNCEREKLYSHYVVQFIYYLFLLPIYNGIRGVHPRRNKLPC